MLIIRHQFKANLLLNRELEEMLKLLDEQKLKLQGDLFAKLQPMVEDLEIVKVCLITCFIKLYPQNIV